MGRVGGPLAIGFLFLAAAVSAQAQPGCSLTQITSSPLGAHSHNPSINSAGTRIAFTSSANLSGGNVDGGFEIFFWDVATGFTQLTDMDSQFPPALAINGAGDRIAFASREDVLGSNADHNFEIFLWAASAGLTQITNTTGGDNLQPDINDAGNRITFSAYGHPLDAEGNREIYLWDAATGLAQITNTTTEWENAYPSINASGTRIAFHSRNLSFTPGNPWNFEIFLWDGATGIQQITDTTNDSSFAAINAAGDRIAFANGPVVQPDGAPAAEIHLWDASTGFTRVTQRPINSSGDSNRPAINAAGNRIAFSSTANLLGNGGGNLDLFLWDAAAGLTQITNTTVEFSLSASINAAGDLIAFSSVANLVGTNTERNSEIFLASCQGILAEAAVPAVSPLGLAALAVLLGLAAAWTLRRRVQAQP